MNGIYILFVQSHQENSCRENCEEIVKERCLSKKRSYTRRSQRKKIVDGKNNIKKRKTTTPEENKPLKKRGKITRIISKGKYFKIVIFK